MAWSTPISGSGLHAFIAHRRAPGESLYAVVDAARDREMVLTAENRYGLWAQSLFGSAAAGHMAEVAPYLIRVPLEPAGPDSSPGYLDVWAEELGTSSGILLLTNADEDKLFVHLGRVFRVTDEGGHPYYFRFYDPRVLRVYLPTCGSGNSANAGDAAEFFGSVRCILVEAEAEGRMIVCTRSRGGAVLNEQPIEPAPVSGAAPGGRR